MCYNISMNILVLSDTHELDRALDVRAHDSRFCNRPHHYTAVISLRSSRIETQTGIPVSFVPGNREM